MKAIESPSPNFDERGRDIDTVILHYTGMISGAEALSRLCDPAAKVSAHYLIEEDGTLYRLVEERCCAWHAGVSSWRGERDLNARSIGIEIVNPGHEWGYRDFPSVQILSVTDLLGEILVRHNITPARVLGHSDVAPGRKEDPGEKFPWACLAMKNLAIAPYDGPPDASISYEDSLGGLRAIGYEIPDAAPGRPAPAAALLAFQRRFCPASLGQGMDPLTKAAIRAIGRLV